MNLRTEIFKFLDKYQSQFFSDEMNVGGILDFKPEVNAKRGVDDDDIATSVPAAKVRRKLKEIEKSRKDLPFEQLTDEEKLKMLQAAESDVAVNPLSGWLEV